MYYDCVIQIIASIYIIPVEKMYATQIIMIKQRERHSNKN